MGAWYGVVCAGGRCSCWCRSSVSRTWWVGGQVQDRAGAGGVGQVAARTWRSRGQVQVQVGAGVQGKRVSRR